VGTGTPGTPVATSDADDLHHLDPELALIDL